MDNISLKMESIPVSQYNEDPMMSSQSLFSGETKLINLTDTINPALYQPTATMLSSSPTYASLEPVYLSESTQSVATSNPQCFGHTNSSCSLWTINAPSPTTQAVYSYATNVPPISHTDLPSLHPNLYRNPELKHLVKDEGIGSSTSPSSESSTSPPLKPQQYPGFGQIVQHSRPSSNYDCSLRSSSSSPASPVSLNYSTAPECSNCGIRFVEMRWCNTHYLCNQCLQVRPTVLAAAPSSVLPEMANSNKRKRSTTAARNINQVCTNCDATYSKLWRRSISTGDTVCNACGLYEKLHHVPRPKSMRKDSIQTRKRKPKVPQSPKSKKSPRKTQKKLQETPVEQQQYIPNSGANYSLPNYQTLQVRNLYADLHNQHPSPNITTMSHQSLYVNQRNDIYRHDIFNPVSPNDIINIPSNMPSTNMQFTNS